MFIVLSSAAIIQLAHPTQDLRLSFRRLKLSAENIGVIGLVAEPLTNCWRLVRVEGITVGQFTQVGTSNTEVFNKSALGGGTKRLSHSSPHRLSAYALSGAIDHNASI